MQFDMETTLFNFGGEDNTAYTFRHAVMGCQVFGSTGSGKTTGAGFFLLSRLMSVGCGGLILTAKPTDKNDFIEYCRLTGRSKDLVVIEPGGKEYFNFLEYESTRDSDKTFTANLVEVLRVVIRSRDEKGGGKSDDRFWEESLNLLIASCIDLSLFAYNKVTVPLLYEIANSVPDKSKDSAFEKAMAAAQDNIQAKIDKWRSDIGERFLDGLADDVYNEALFEDVPEARTYTIVENFFTQQYRKLNERTRSIISMSLTSFLINLLRDPFYTLFCTKTTVTPEDCYTKGKIILLNIPVKLFHKVGQDIQIMFKYIWQRAMEKRNISENGMPVFLYADESHLFIHEQDAEFQATARSSRVCTLYLSQSLNGYHANIGGAKSEYRVKGFLATMGTKLFLYNTDIETNTWASQLIGQSYETDQSQTTSSVQGKVSESLTQTTKLTQTIRPEQFAGLKGGGPSNNFKVSGYIHVQGMKFSNGFSHRYIVFDQKFTPSKFNS
ncbi:type IV secretory system conjugative DNA transfer family protein [Taibaiella koreensis]|uniref:type IV secretory system conjugative DNA transfer family protein n=1 Tax=Taibaiella koreensis TaxID=1268548 RepID=UPI000E59ED09|nr:TraM recognition domain-containing protein [Taibaiella koreensis]